ncbi:hypothetical protein SATMO3_60950 [Sporomusa aerivorans]
MGVILKKDYLVVLSEGTISGIIIIFLYSYISSTVALLAYISYSILRMGWSNILLQPVFWVTTLVVSTLHLFFLNKFNIESIQIDAILLAVVSLILHYIMPIIKNRFIFLNSFIKIIIVLSCGILVGFCSIKLSDTGTKFFLLALIGSWSLISLGSTWLLIIRTLLFSISYLLTLFVLWNGVNFLNYNFYEAVNMYTPFFIPLFITCFLPLLSYYANKDMVYNLPDIKSFFNNSCSHCGTRLKRSNNFCTSCGNSVKTEKG